jgi:glyoxylase I family protein
MPQWSKVSHTSFSVRDVERSAEWCAHVLGATELERVAGDGWRAVLLQHPASGTVLEYQEHDANDGSVFDPRRSGLDHIGFLVRDRDALDEWASFFEAEGVDHTPVVDRDYGAVLTFRDPDGIQLEMFWRPNHP